MILLSYTQNIAVNIIVSVISLFLFVRHLYNKLLIFTQFSLDFIFSARQIGILISLMENKTN